MSRKFTLVIFTASNQEYADKIIDKLDPNDEFISSRFYRYHCTFHDGKLTMPDVVTKICTSRICAFSRIEISPI